MNAVRLGGELRRVRREANLSQSALAARCGLHLETIAGLERDRGTVASLTVVLTALGHWFEVQYDPSQSLGEHLEERRRKMSKHVEGRLRGKITKTRLAEMSGISRPSLEQVLTDRGQVNTLVSVMHALGLSLRLVPATAAAEAPPLRLRSHIREVHHGDCREIMTQLEAGSIDVVFTSPPYNAGKASEESLNLVEYLEFVREWTAELPRLLSPKANVWLNLGYTLDDGQAVPLTYLYYPIMRAHGFRLVQEIVWRYEGGMAYKRRFTHRTERLQWWTLDNNFRFYLDAVHEPGENRTDDPRNNPRGKNPGDYWYFDRVAASSAEKTLHPCQTPEVIIERVIKSCSRPGQIILDPFGGSGTTGVVASGLGRGFILIEKDEQYVSEASQRLEAAVA
ncbi:DNA methyltransferase [Methylobacterium sp. E-066]|uniref:DNA methyltransferase n=1 Tax=Methylobacterium sp. E-066 TaxID=2836584 RepID=UPI001FBAFD54|nr:DNA methyltransferase [Methylobacterium sp. E-066]MCJ2144804.1 helix-turn-helix domain-containing protein [Methylobacterium sp. E-066]